MKQTAIEWLEQAIKLYVIRCDLHKEFKQAKEMEKEQIIDCFNQGYTQCSIEDLEPKSRERFVDAKDYYNKTFKSE